MAIEIIEQDGRAILEARVTVYADNANRAAMLAEGELSRHCRKTDTVAAVTQYKVASKLHVAGGWQYELVFGEFSR